MVELTELFSRSSMRTFLADLDEDMKALYALLPVQRSPIVKPPIKLSSGSGKSA